MGFNTTELSACNVYSICNGSDVDAMPMSMFDMARLQFSLMFMSEKLKVRHALVYANVYCKRL